ncbi:alpha/beta hydrolase [Tupanvirus soda lake]|uniref:Alpha/beta hydrolase n=2 Tax=Tupanvirus TaxID=2094720 RepID=A0A6N1NPS1_9VIRU|nr:alpha/beta hydrolase [Tupanvirus soda lake]QKU34777.1 alpha/beta hydrolase [Tupanvirus soda lake]
MPRIYKKDYEDEDNDYSTYDENNYEDHEYDVDVKKHNNNGFETCEFVTSEGLTISYQHCDKRRRDRCGCYEDDCRPSIVLLHGTGYDSNYWICLMKKLCKVANVFALNNPGAGDSDAPNTGSLTLTRLTQNLTEFLNELNLDKVYLVGHGIGGLIALNFAVLYPNRVVKIAVSSVNPRYFPLPGSTWTFFITPELQQLVSQALLPGANLQTLAPIIANLIDPVECEGTERLVDQYINAIEQYRLYVPALQNIDFRNLANQVTVPVLIMEGTRDPLVPVGAANFLRTNIPNSALVEFYGQGSNFPILNKNLYNKTVFNFFFVKCDPCCAFFETIDEVEEECKCICQEYTKYYEHKKKKEKKNDCGCNEKKEKKKEKKDKCGCDKKSKYSDHEFNYKNKIVIPCRYT